MRLYKGMSRALGIVNGRPMANDIGLVFATRRQDTLDKYCSWSNGEALAFDLPATARIADLNDPATARQIAEHYAEMYEWRLIDQGLLDQFVAELSDNDGHDEITIMDDAWFRQSVADLGFDGACQGGQYALFESAWES